MSSIQHKIRIEANSGDVHRAISTIDGLSAWWTRTTDGSCDVGEVIQFRFGEHVTRARVSTTTATHVAWTIHAGADDWVGTQISFELEAVDGATVLRFAHSHWRSQSDFMAHCSMKWATFLLSLRDHVERGEGRPFPNDVAI